MLTKLRIKNLALVSDLTLELRPGCNVITGETGAGNLYVPELEPWSHVPTLNTNWR